MVVSRDDNYGEATVAVTLRNTGIGEVVFSLIELRVDLYYESVLVNRHLVTTEYLEREFDEFGPGSTETLSDEIRFQDTHVDGSEPDRNYSLDIQFRHVSYRTES